MNKIINEAVNGLLFVVIAVSVYCILWGLDNPTEFKEFVTNVAHGFAGNSVHVLFVNIGWLVFGFVAINLISHIYSKFTAKQ